MCGHNTDKSERERVGERKKKQFPVELTTRLDWKTGECIDEKEGEEEDSPAHVNCV